METNNVIEIGTSSVTYTIGGEVIEASFLPVMKVKIQPDALKQCLELQGADKGNSQDKIRAHAELTMAAWFSQMNEVELADRENYHVVTEIVTCEKYPNGNVMQCDIKFTFQPINLQKQLS